MSDDDNLEEYVRGLAGASRIAEPALTFPGLVTPGQAATLADTAGKVAGDELHTAGQVGKDYVTGQVKTAQDTASGLAHAGHDYVDGYSRAAGDLAHGDVAGAAGDVFKGQLNATIDTVETGATAIKDTVTSAVKVGEDVFHGAEEIGHDAITGAKHAIFGGGTDKAGVMKKVGGEGFFKTLIDNAQHNAGVKKLASIKSALAANNPSAFATADQILDPGKPGLDFFEFFLPAFNEWTGSDVQLSSLVTLYEREHGMNFAAFVKDAKLLTAAATRTDDITDTLQQAYNALIPTWQGSAASQFETSLTAYFSADANVSKTFTAAAKGIDQVVLALQKLIYTKASTVSQLYLMDMPPGIDGVQAVKALIPVARDSGCDDEMRRWVLGTLGQPMSGRHAWDDDGNMYSSDSLDDNSRNRATQVAGQWLDQVLAPQVSQRLELLTKISNSTSSGIQQVFSTLIGDFRSVKDQFASMSTGTPTDTPPKAPGNNGSSTNNGGNQSTSPTGVGPGSPSTPSTPSPGTLTPGTPTPGVPTPGVPTVPTPGVPTVPTPGVPTVPAPGSGTDPAPVTNADGSVTFGPSGDLQVSKENPDGSVTITETGADGTTHQYHVVFGPNGQPVVTPIDGSATVPVAATGDTAGDGGAGAFSDITNGGAAQDGQSVDSAAAADIRTNADGSVSIGADHNVTIGNDQGGQGFTMTQSAAGHDHSFAVTYDSSGHPHVSEVGGDSALDSSPLTTTTAPHLGATPLPHSQGFHAAADSVGSAGGGDLGGGSAGTSAAAFGGGDAGSSAGGDSAGGAGGGASTGGDTSGQIGVGDRFGATAAASSSAAPADAATGAATAANAGGHSGGAVGGMPMGMGGGMGRGAGGGAGEELKRRYQPPAESVVDDAELEEWDRLGPTIG